MQTVESAFVFITVPVTSNTKALLFVNLREKELMMAFISKIRYLQDSFSILIKTKCSSNCHKSWTNVICH